MNLDVYRRDPEAQLIGSFVGKLASRSVIHVEAERGLSSRRCLTRERMKFTRSRWSLTIQHSFGAVSKNGSRVHLRDYAASDKDALLELPSQSILRAARAASGIRCSTPPTPVRWARGETVPVQGRSLASLLSAGEIPGMSAP
jgi:hypothetical protein